MYFATFILRNLTRRPARTVLTVLGLSVAVASMVALLGISHNVTATVTETFDRRGVDLIAIAGGKTDQLSSDLDASLVERVRALPGVIGVESAMLELIEIPRGTGSVSVLVQGWAPSSFSFDDLKMTAGRRLEDGDAGRVMLGTTLAESLNKRVGDTVALQGEPFEVIGVYQSYSVFENGGATILLSEIQRLSARPGRVTGFSVRVDKSGPDPAAAVEAVRAEIAGMAGPDGTPARLSAQPTRDYVATASHLLLTKAMAWMVSAVAVLIGVISMLNTMVMSVLERTQEIGILRAVGWPRRRIVTMVLGEAVMLGLAAAVVGSAAAEAGTHVLSRFPKVNGFIEGGVPLRAVAEGAGMMVLVGLVGGAYPAIRAARLLPTEALRHD